MRKLLVFVVSIAALSQCKKKSDNSPNPDSGIVNASLPRLSCRLLSYSVSNNGTVAGSQLYNYDSEGNLVKIKSLDDNGVYDPSQDVSYTYVGGRATSFSFGNAGTVSTYMYSYTGNLITKDTLIFTPHISGQQESSTIYRYDKAGNLLSKVTTIKYPTQNTITMDSTAYSVYINGRPSRRVNYVHTSDSTDLTYRLIETLSYEYDKNGNRIKTTRAYLNNAPYTQEEVTFDLTVLTPLRDIYSDNPNPGHIDQDRNVAVGYKSYGEPACTGPGAPGSSSATQLYYSASVQNLVKSVSNCMISGTETLLDETGCTPKTTVSTLKFTY